jgi:hypothetical protein
MPTFTTIIIVFLMVRALLYHDLDCSQASILWMGPFEALEHGFMELVELYISDMLRKKLWKLLGNFS